MIRRTLLPLGLLAFAFMAFVFAAWSVTDGNDLAGLYGVVVALVALRAQSRIVAVAA